MVTRPDSDDAIVRRLDLVESIRRLSSADRLVLFLSFFLDYALDDVARILGVSPAATKARLYRAVERLRPEINAQEAAD